MIKSVCFLTSGQPSANPRVVKEATTFAQNGYNTTVIYCHLSQWADRFDQALFEQHSNICWVKVGSHPQKQKIRYLYAILRKKLYHFLFHYFGDILDSAVKSMVLFNQELTQEALNTKADMYIGHNLGALPAVVKAARKYKAKAYFDFEDFHRGEDSNTSYHYKKTILIEDKYIPCLEKASTASPLITMSYQMLYPNQQFYTILNCFTKCYQLTNLLRLPNEPLKLFWFSQTIGKNRGLEQILEAMGSITTIRINLTLLGNLNNDTKDYFQNLASSFGLKRHQLIFLGPVSEKEIVNIAANHHIGVASEITHNLNRELCLTNKIFMYLLAGNCILFSDTKAQTSFLKNNSEIGKVYEQGNIVQISNILKELSTNNELLNHCRKASFELAKKFFNWEYEQSKYEKFYWQG